MQELIPDSVSIEARNKRLYETLKGMGLYVTAVPRKDYTNVIDYILVSAVAPGVPLTYLEGAPTSQNYFSPD